MLQNFSNDDKTFFVVPETESTFLLKGECLVKHMIIFSITDVFTSEKDTTLRFIVPKNNVLCDFIRLGYLCELLTVVHLMTIS